MNKIGIISEVKDDKARVAIGSLVTDFLKVFMPLANSYAVAASPIKVGEQVLVMAVEGDINSGVILRGLFYDKHKLEVKDNECEVVFSDGVKMSYNTSSSTLTITAPKNINIKTTTFNIDGNLKVSGDISDSRGDLTGHSHNDTDGFVSSPR
ncbi:phage baseplate assembly protein V [Campylobacter blaseri]|uniref:Baseplate assembly protein n=1 Tax=Campylobacter blaseri TaxID=2042961 RepID=A0A2P8QYP3_9BACT|nr:phage baseplate assembly protein V [Campylobacter blaseri]PSM51361.1 baseplate assembly protein [Campylobacter blaseri]PSM52811.1 baseplate assembly protein [Campylobacter blaseri]QKF86112.1 phage baseplate assembly protein V [Campylobacter blaseri]